MVVDAVANMSEWGNNREYEEELKVDVEVDLYVRSLRLQNLRLSQASRGRNSREEIHPAR
jgi:hypothetical protein